MFNFSVCNFGAFFKLMCLTLASSETDDVYISLITHLLKTILFLLYYKTSIKKEQVKTTYIVIEKNRIWA